MGPNNFDYFNHARRHEVVCVQLRQASVQNDVCMARLKNNRPGYELLGRYQSVQAFNKTYFVIFLCVFFFYFICFLTIFFSLF